MVPVAADPGSLSHSLRGGAARAASPAGAGGQRDAVVVPRGVAAAGGRRADAGRAGAVLAGGLCGSCAAGLRWQRGGLQAHSSACSCGGHLRPIALVTQRSRHRSHPRRQGPVKLLPERAPPHPTIPAAPTDARHSQWRPRSDKREQLTGTLFVLFVLLVLASSMIYFAERYAQPDYFSCIPAAVWWGGSTLSGAGFEDAHPATIAGRMIASAVGLL